MKEFHKEYLGFLPEITEEEIELRKLVKEYHERTESYDRTVCSGPIIDNSIMPADGYERSLINKNARVVYKEILERVYAIGLTREEFEKENRFYLRTQKRL